MKIAMMLPNPNDATSMARGAMPMAMLARSARTYADLPLWIDEFQADGSSPQPLETTGGTPVEPAAPIAIGAALCESIELVTREAWSWSDVSQCDLVFIQRPYTADHYQLAVMAKQLGLPLWIDYDDALDVLPESNPLWSMKFAREAAAHVNACSQLADVVSVTTMRLAERVSVMIPAMIPRNPAGEGARRGVSGGAPDTAREARAIPAMHPKLRIIPNAHNDYLMPFIDLGKMPRQKIMTWRGSATHDEDLATILPQLVEVANAPEFADWKFAFLGDPPWEVRKLMPVKRTLYSAEGWKNYFLFMNEWAGCCPAIHLVPLAETEFNRCKSNLAWLEASAVGAVTLAPGGGGQRAEDGGQSDQWPEWERPGVWRYGTNGTNGTDDFAGVLAAMMREFSATGTIQGQKRTGEMPVPLPAVGESRDYIREHLLLSQVNQLRLEIIRDLVKAPASKLVIPQQPSSVGEGH